MSNLDPMMKFYESSRVAVMFYLFVYRNSISIFSRLIRCLLERLARRRLLPKRASTRECDAPRLHLPRLPRAPG